jgi:hypothetical protein
MACYAVLAKKAGFIVTTEKTSLNAIRKKDGAAFHVDAVADGTRIDLTSNRGANKRGR